MKRRESIRKLRQPSSYEYGYMWRINSVSCYYEVVMVNLDPDRQFWDCWVNPYGGNTIHYTKAEFENLEVYSTPDEALIAMLKSDKYEGNVSEWNPERLVHEIQNYLDYDGKRVDFMFGSVTLADKFMECETVDEFSDFIEEHCEDVIGMFEF